MAGLWRPEGDHRQPRRRKGENEEKIRGNRGCPSIKKKLSTRKKAGGKEKGWELITETRGKKDA